MPRGILWKVRDPYSVSRGLLRMSWNRTNLYNLAHKELPDLSRLSVFQQRWIAKRETRAYHVPNIPQRQFLDRHFKTTLPVQRLTRKDREKVPPMQSLMFAELERRVDVVLFRSHFASSIFSARRAVSGGHVTVNGVKCPYPGWRLKDGDLVTIEPRLVPTLFPPGTAKASAASASTEDKDNEKEDDSASKKEVQKPKKKTPSDPSVPLEFKASPYMSPWMFIPAYLEVDYNTTSVVFLRSPLPQPNRVEIPSPFPPNWHQWTYDWYTMQKQKKKRIRVKPPIVINDRLVKLKPKFDRVFRRIRDARMQARRELRL